MLRSNFADWFFVQNNVPVPSLSTSFRHTQYWLGGAIPIGYLGICFLVFAALRMEPSSGGLKMLGPGSDTLRWCGMVGGAVAWLEKVYHCGIGL